MRLGLRVWVGAAGKVGGKRRACHPHGPRASPGRPPPGEPEPGLAELRAARAASHVRTRTARGEAERPKDTHETTFDTEARLLGKQAPAAAAARADTTTSATSRAPRPRPRSLEPCSCLLPS